MRRVFLNNELERVITEKGYAVIKNFSSAAICDDLSGLFDKFNAVDKRPFTITNWNKDADYRSKTFAEISNKMLPASCLYLDRYKPVMGVFTAKRPGENSSMLLHQDWSLVDETKFRSVSVWMALCDMNHDNGNLQVAEQSHLYAGFPRGMNIPVPFENIRAELHSNSLIDIPLKKGDAVIFDHRLIHASPENGSDKIRLAAVLALIPEEAELIHYYKYPDAEDMLEILKLNENDFHLLDFFDMPNKPKHVAVKGRVPATFRQIEAEETHLS